MNINRKFITLTIFMVTCLSVEAQGVLLHKGNSYTYFSSTDVDSIEFVEAPPVDKIGTQVLDVEQTNSIRNILLLLAYNSDNIQLTCDGMLQKLFSALDPTTPVEIPGGEAMSLHPCISIIDDDTFDYQIPSSYNGSKARDNQGGYFSVLLPMMLSLGNKYHKNLCPGLACEGQRVGLTHFLSPNDSYTELNENGRAVKWLHDQMGWNVFNHSMTGQIPMSNTYYVDGINSDLAQRIINENTYYDLPYSFTNCIVLDRLTGKWYELNNESKESWVERTPTKKYALPFYQDYITKQWYFNRDFDFDYSWGEWFKRANELGLPYEKVIVHNGSTSSVYTASAGRKYAYWSVRTSGDHNYPPIAATVNRTSTAPYSNQSPQGYNVYHPKWVESKKSIIDYCLKNDTWVVFMSHFNDQEYHRNYYLNGKEYPDRDDNYNNEWIIPLKHAEIQDIIGENVHDYIHNPPARLGISSWSEWHPAPGTQLAAFYEVLDYALSKGVEFVSPMEGWSTHGNLLNLGVDKMKQAYSYDDAANQIPYTDEEQSWLTIGADKSIRYYNSKNNK